MKSNEISFVVQGAINHSISPLTGLPITQSCVGSLRRHHPGAEIILSTWQDQDLTGLEFDKLVMSEDPGAVNPHTPQSGLEGRDNMNRQIVSTRNGLKEATRKYAAKVRNDLIFQGSDWMKYWGRYPARSPEWKIFKERVVAVSMFARDPRCGYSNFPLHPTDWLHIGLLEDINLLWDIPLEPQPESARWFASRPIQFQPPIARDLSQMHVDYRRYYAEQYLWVTLLRRHKEIGFTERRLPTEEDIFLTEISFANNLIMLDPNHFPFVNHKYPFPFTPSYHYYRFIAHKDWERLYMKYCSGQNALANARKALDKDFYLKKLYMASFAPVQAMRKLAVARTQSQPQEASHG